MKYTNTKSESNDNLKELDKKGDLFLDKFNKFSEQNTSNDNKEVIKERKRSFNFQHKSKSNSNLSYDLDYYYKEDIGQKYYQTRKGSFNRKQQYKKGYNYNTNYSNYNNNYSNYNNQYFNEDAIINELTNKKDTKENYNYEDEKKDNNENKINENKDKKEIHKKTKLEKKTSKKKVDELKKENNKVKKTENLHEKVTTNFSSDAKNLKDLLG